MSRVQIPINGISTTSSYKDGDVLAISNLRKKNGALKPVTPRLVTKTLQKKYDYIFVHDLPSGASNNYIGVRDDEVFYIENPGNAETESETSLCEVSGFISITQIGNVLNILDANGLQHVLWFDNEYKLINTDFDGEQTDTEIFCKVDLKVDGYNDSGDRTLTHHYTEDEVLWHSNDVDTINLRKKLASSLFVKGIAYNNEQGRLTGYVLACTAFELYDGSFILHSNPVLLGMAYDEKSRYSGLTVNGTTYDYSVNPAKYYPLSGSWEEITSNADNQYKLSKNKIKAGTSESVGYNELTDKFGYVCGTYYLKIDGGTVSKRMVAIMSSNNLKLRVNGQISSDYSSLIKSISVFITPQVSLYDLTKDSKYLGYFDYNGNSSAYCENYIPEVKDIKDIIKELESLNFYKVKEIQFDDIQTDTWIDLTEDLKGKLGDNLVSQEVLPVDNFTHHKLIPQKQYIYNSKLHAMDYKTVLSHGFPFNYFIPNQGTGQFAATSNPNVPYNTNDYRNYVEVTIKTETGLSKVVRYTEAEFPLTDLMPMLSYPDSRAIKMVIYWYAYYTVGQTGVFNKMEFPLKASEIGNFAYYISPDLKPIRFNSNTVGTKEAIPSEVNRGLFYRNGMKASAMNNPFTFPSIQTYKVGTGIIRGAASNAMRISEGQFGQYPLYVFTTDRIYAMNVGTGEVLYTTQSAVSNEAPISDILCQTPYGVVFLGKRGLFIINGQQVNFISPQLEQYPVELNVNYLDTGITEATPFSELTISNILYDAQNNEIIIVNQGNNLVYNLDSKEFYTSTERIDHAVENVYPDLYVMQENTDEVTEIKDFSQESESTQQVYFSTRPFNFGTPDKKRLERLILRARLHDASGLKTVVFASHDGINFSAIHGKYLPDGNRRDIDMLHPAKRNYFMFAFIGTLDKESEITMLEAEVNQDTNSSKMR